MHAVCEPATLSATCHDADLEVSAFSDRFSSFLGQLRGEANPLSHEELFSVRIIDSKATLPALQR